ncbi:MAG: hypothetical protein AAF721_24810 [Myxococcota bacterium]
MKMRRLPPRLMKACALATGIVCAGAPVPGAAAAPPTPAEAPAKPDPAPAAAPPAASPAPPPAESPAPTVPAPPAGPVAGPTPADVAPPPEPASATAAPAAAEPAPAAEPVPVAVTPEAPVEAEPSPAPPPHFGEINLEAVPARVDGPRPYPGTGQIVGGGILVGTGALNMLGGALLLAARDGAPSPEARDLADTAGKAGLIVGSIYVVGGGVLLFTGTRSRRRYREWAARNHLSPPKSGNGMLVGGSILAGSAALDIAIAAGLGTGTPLSYTLDGLQLGAGVVLLAIGGVRRSKYSRWLTKRDISWAPTLAPHRRGATAGITGRF